MVSGVAEFVCEVTYNSSTYSGTLTINDIQDQYMIEKGRVTKNASGSTVENTGILKPSYTVTYTPSIIDKTTGGAPSSMPGTWSFTFILKNAAGSVISTTSGNTMTVTGGTVRNAGGVTVLITAENSSL